MFEFFSQPTQVKFWDFEANCYLGGIGYKSKIICLACGEVIDLDDYNNKTFPDGVDKPIITLPWITLSDECLGEYD